MGTVDIRRRDDCPYCGRKQSDYDLLYTGLGMAVETARVATEAHQAFLAEQTPGNAAALKDAMDAVALLAGVPTASV